MLESYTGKKTTHSRKLQTFWCDVSDHAVRRAFTPSCANGLMAVQEFLAFVNGTGLPIALLYVSFSVKQEMVETGPQLHKSAVNPLT